MAAVSTADDGSYLKSDKLRTFVQEKDVLLLKASAIAGLLAGCSLRVLENLQGRQDLEKYASHCIAEGTLVDRCMREVDAAATSDVCTYPGVVVISYCWHSATHPDPSGLLSKNVAKYLHWYAAQRAGFTNERLYQRHEDLRQQDEFHWEFVVLIDFWSLYQHPRSELQEESYRRALHGMHYWYAHRGTMVFLVRDVVPSDWEGSAECRDRGGYDDRGWTVWEKMMSSHIKIAGMCLDMAGFEAMTRTAIVKGGVNSKGMWWPRQLTGNFENQSLQTLAMGDGNGLVTKHRSCLKALVAQSYTPPLSYTDMQAELSNKSFGVPEDQAVCMAMYQPQKILASVKKLVYSHIRLWTVNDWRRIGEMINLCPNLQRLDLTNSLMWNAGMKAFAEALEPDCAPNLRDLVLLGNQVRAAGLEALGVALRRGAMPNLEHVIIEDLKRTVGLAGVVLRTSAVDRFEAALEWGFTVTYDEKSCTLTIDRGFQRRTSSAGRAFAAGRVKLARAVEGSGDAKEGEERQALAASAVCVVC